MRLPAVLFLLAFSAGNNGRCAEPGRLTLELEPEPELEPHEAGAATRSDPVPLELEPDPEQDEWWLPARVPESVPADCSSSDPCNLICTLKDLVPSVINSTQQDHCQDDTITWTVRGSADSVLRLWVSAGSRLASDERLTVLEEGETLAALGDVAGGRWVSSSGSNMTLVYALADPASRGELGMTLVAYNRTNETVTLTEASGVLEAPEQTNWTGKPDYALNTELLWHIHPPQVLHINLTLESLRLDPVAGDMLVIGYGKGPYNDSEFAGAVLTGNFTTQRYHIEGDEAFVYFLSRHHAEPQPPFKITYVSKPDDGPTTTMVPTTTTLHPPTPTGRSVELAVYVTGADPRIFLNKSSGATSLLSELLAKYTDLYRIDNNVDTAPIHSDDIRYTTWLLCDYASGWVEPDADCFRVTWYVEALTSDGGWALYSDDLRRVVVRYCDSINRDIDNKGYTYRVSLELNEINKNWWWSFTYILLPLALVIFLLLWWNRNTSNKVKAQMENTKTKLDDLDLDEEELNEEKQIISDEKDRQFSKTLGDDDEFEDYDPQLRSKHQRRRLHARFRPAPPATAAPLKSALKSPKTPAQANPAFEPEEQVFFPPDGSPPPPPPAAAPEVTEQLRRVDELNRSAPQQQEREQEPGLELPRIQGLKTPDEAGDGPARIYSMNDDGTGVLVEEAHPEDNIFQLDAAASLRKTSSV